MIHLSQLLLQLILNLYVGTQEEMTIIYIHMNRKYFHQNQDVSNYLGLMHFNVIIKRDAEDFALNMTVMDGIQFINNMLE